MLQKLKRRILVHRKLLHVIILLVCSSMKHASLSRQTVALLPLCFCTCNQDLFCIKNLFSAVCEAFFLIQVKVSFVFILFDRTDFPCLCSALVCEWRSTTVCLYLKGNCCNEIHWSKWTFWPWHYFGSSKHVFCAF